MNVMAVFQVRNLIDYNGAVKLPLKTLQRILTVHNITAVRFNEALGLGIIHNTMTHGGIEFPPDDHDSMLVGTLPVSSELLVLAGVGLESQTLQKLMGDVLHGHIPKTMWVRGDGIFARMQKLKSFGVSFPQEHSNTGDEATRVIVLGNRMECHEAASDRRGS
jgi:hypothetical protein